MQKFRRTIFTVATALLATPALLTAQTVYNTGAPGNVNGSFQDAAWQVSTNGGGSWSQALQVQGPPGVWVSGSSFSWIAATTSASGGGGNYLFRTFIDLTGYDPTTATLSFNCALDNFANGGGGNPYSLNGGAYTGACGVFGFGATQTVSSGWTSGVNELRFAVGGDNTTDGLAVGNATISARVTATPEPASMVLMATGLLLVGSAVRRRSQSA